MPLHGNTFQNRADAIRREVMALKRLFEYGARLLRKLTFFTFDFPGCLSGHQNQRILRVQADVEAFNLGAKPLRQRYRRFQRRMVTVKAGQRYKDGFDHLSILQFASAEWTTTPEHP
jgi:hypothetical protein